MLPRKCNGELKNFSASLDDLMPYYKPNLPVANSISVNEILTHLTGAKIQGMLLKSTTKIDCKSIVSTLMKNPITHENMFKIRSKSTDLIIKKEIALTLLEDLLNCIFTSGHLLLKKARYKVIKSSNQTKIKITANLTEEDGFRKLATISNHKNSYFYSCKYLKNHN